MLQECNVFFQRSGKQNQVKILQFRWILIKYAEYITHSDLYVISTGLQFICDFGLTLFGLTGTHLYSLCPIHRGSPLPPNLVASQTQNEFPGPLFPASFVANPERVRRLIAPELVSAGRFSCQIWGVGVQTTLSLPNHGVRHGTHGGGYVHDSIRPSHPKNAKKYASFQKTDILCVRVTLFVACSNQFYFARCLHLARENKDPSRSSEHSSRSDVQEYSPNTTWFAGWHLQKGSTKDQNSTYKYAQGPQEKKIIFTQSHSVCWRDMQHEHTKYRNKSSS